jgi:transcriptional regulator with XRE-family HTH domain
MYSCLMEIGPKLKELREAKNLSQGDIEERTGLLRCYTSRVENSHTVPSVDTLEKYARALEVPLYRLFTDEKDIEVLKLPQTQRKARGVTPKDGAELRAFAKALAQLDERKRKLILAMAQRMAGRVTESPSVR